MASNTKNFKKQGGENWEITGEININGGEITSEGTQAGAIADHGDPSSASNEDIATKQNSILAALRGVGIIADS